MKKVFSVKKFEEWCKRLGFPNEDYEKSCEIWANKCDGLTKEEMNELGYACSDDWTIKVEEKTMEKKEK